jgi:hypothetical protein
VTVRVSALAVPPEAANGDQLLASRFWERKFAEIFQQMEDD